MKTSDYIIRKDADGKIHVGKFVTTGWWVFKHSKFVCVDWKGFLNNRHVLSPPPPTFNDEIDARNWIRSLKSKQSAEVIFFDCQGNVMNLSILQEYGIF